MKVRKGQGIVQVEDLSQVLTIKAHVWGDPEEVWTVLRIQPQTVERDATLRGEGRPVKYVQSGEDIMLFPVPDDAYSVEITYHTTPKRV